MMMPAKLPDKAVDGFRIEWFDVDPHSGISLRSAVYHVDSPYPGPIGVRIVDEWMIYEGARSTGRTNTGWTAIKPLLVDTYQTYADARHAYVAKLEAQVKAAIAANDRLRTRLIRLPQEFDPTYSEFNFE